MGKNNPKLLFATSEMSPFAKTGGLADFVLSLPLYLKQLGVDIFVVMPKYSFIKLDKYPKKQVLSPLGVHMGDKLEWAGVVRVDFDVPVYMIEHNLYFDRDGLYHDDMMNDYSDNPRRFAFFSRAVIQLCKDLKLKVDVIHTNDWQTALIAAYLKIWDFNDPIVGSTASLLTLHNAAYQGIYPKEHYSYLGLGDANFVSSKFEDSGSINFLKGGIAYSDLVNTVSKGYANEIKSPYGGFGLAPYLNNKGSDFVGILNGVNYDEWSPDKDKYIHHHYDKDNLLGKEKNKRALQRFFFLERKDIPVFGIIGRFVKQKGYDFLMYCVRRILDSMNVQFVILGSGDNLLESFFVALTRDYKGRVGSYIGYNERLAHLIEAGSDFFVMPSLYEPCGLNQLYSLRYGTLPIVHATGGLDETVINYDEATGEGTGFKFYYASADALYDTIGWAVSTYFDRKHHMKKLIQNAMSKDYSWKLSAKEYLKAYKKAIRNKKAYDKLFDKK